MDGQEGGCGHTRALLGESLPRCARVDVGRETTSGDGILLNVSVQVYVLVGYVSPPSFPSADTGGREA
jgi:hypothetical protein